MKLHVRETARVLTLGELAEYLKVHPSTIYRLLKTQQMPAFKVGGVWRFNLEQIDRWRFERQKKSASDEAAS